MTLDLEALKELAGRATGEGSDYDPYEDEYDFDEDDGFDECGMMPDGYCTLAGSEWCDWDCPRNKPAPTPPAEKEG